MRHLYVLAAALLLAAPVSAQFEWREAWGGQEVHLFYQGRLVGGWNVTGQHYLAHDGSGWNARRAAPPVPVPTQYIAAAENFGVMTEKLRHGGAPSYKIGDREVTRDEAISAVEKGVPDYGNRFRLTVIGSEAERKKVTDDWNSIPALAPLREKTLVWSVAPDHWSLKDNKTGELRYVNTGHPTIYFQAPKSPETNRGKVLHRQDNYQGPGDFAAIAKAAGVQIDAQALAPQRWDGPAQVEEERSGAGGYDPTKDPDARKGGLPLFSEIGPLARRGAAAFLAVTVPVLIVTFHMKRRKLGHKF